MISGSERGITKLGMMAFKRDLQAAPAALAELSIAPANESLVLLRILVAVSIFTASRLAALTVRSSMSIWASDMLSRASFLELSSLEDSVSVMESKVRRKRVSAALVSVGAHMAFSICSRPNIVKALEKRIIE